MASTILKDHLAAHPESRDRVLEIIRAGVRMWDEVPDREFVIHREELFQEGMLQHADKVGDYEIWPGVKMIDTTPEQRYDMAERWTDEMARSRLGYMGLPLDALDSGGTGAPA